MSAPAVPPGVDPHESNGGVIFRLSVAMTVLPTTSFVLRTWACLAREKVKLGWDDLFALLAWLCSLACSVLTFLGVKYGFGRHVWTLDGSNDVSRLLRLLYLGEVLFDAGISFCKFSALLFYLRIFTAKSRRFKWVFWATFALTFAYAAYRIGFRIGSCSPPQKFWNPSIPGTCINGYSNLAILLSGLIGDVVTDFLILLLPMPVISGLHMSRTKRSMIIATFSCGYVAWILSFGRMGASIAARPQLDTPDFTWNLPRVLEWSLAELGISVFSICVPMWFYMLRNLSDAIRKLISSSALSGTSIRHLISRTARAERVHSHDSVSDEECGIPVTAQARQERPINGSSLLFGEKTRIVNVRTDISVEHEPMNGGSDRDVQPWASGEAFGLNTASTDRL